VLRLLFVIIVAMVLAISGCGDRRQASPPPSAPTPAPSAEPAPSPTQPPPESGTTPAPAPETSAPAPPTSQPPAATTEPRVDAVVAKGITDTHEPTNVTTEFTEDDQRIYVVHGAALPKGAYFFATLVAVNAEAIEANKEVESSCIPSGCGRNSDKNPVKEGARSVVILPAPRHGFSLGDYRLDLEVKCWNAQPCTDAKSSQTLKVVSVVPAAGAPAQAVQVEGFNIAAAALGGKVVSATSQRNDTSRAAANLIDGHPFIITDISDCQYSCGWFSVGRKTDATVEAHKANFPQDLVFSFYKEREASVHAVVVDTTPYQHWHTVEHLPRHVEVWASTTSPTDGFSKVASARMPRQHGVHVIGFSPAQAKYIRFRILSNYGERFVWMGEVKIIEAPGASSILADGERNLASFALGGVVVRFTSVRGHHKVSALVDGSTDRTFLPELAEFPRNWISADDTLPQEFVFAFRGDQVALIDRIVLTTKPDPSVRGLAPDSEAADPKNWPQQISVSVSSETPLDGFEEVGQFTLKQQPGRQSFPINRRARFLKLRILKNFGGGRTALNDVKILEGSAPGYQSILQTSEAKVIAAAAAVPPVDEGDIDVEKESNNTAVEANPLRLGRRTKGSIDPLGEQDYFKLTIPGSNRSVLTLAMEGRPYIRTSVSLTDQSGKTILNFDPQRATARQAEFSWLVSPGDYIARVTEPPASVVLIWDTSGSMGEESVKSLKIAVEAYLDQVQATERYHLIRFSGSSRDKEPIPVEVFLPEFTSDRARLKGAVEGKFFSKGGTPFYDAVAKGMQLLESAPGNRAIVVMTDGVDTTSSLGGGNDAVRYTAFWRLLEAKRIRLYTIGLGADMPAYYPDLGTTGTRFLGHAAMAMTARSFFTSDPEQLKTIYEQIAAELRTPSTYYLRPSVSPGMGTLSVTASGERLEPIAAPSQIELILDVSGSMKRTIEGRQRMDIAKDVMVQVIKGLPDNSTVALRFYGHRIREGRSGDCQDSELVFPLGRINKAAMINRVRAVKALGTTPIAYTLRQVQRDFGRAQGEKLVILVTDGKEECGGSPSAVVSELVAKGIKIRLNIVGFALAEAAVKQEMERVAKITGGKFYDAQNARSLRQAIQQSLAVAYDVQDAAGARVGGGLTGESPIKVPEGIYTVTVRTSGRPVVVRNVRVRYNGFTKVALRKEGQQIGVKMTGP
jgi:Mg-chelatase subunit ChlD